LDLKTLLFMINYKNAEKHKIQYAN